MSASLTALAADKLADLEARNLRRWLKDSPRDGGSVIVRDGRRMISFCCNDYLNLSQDPRVIAAANAATARYGTGSGGSRLITGNYPLLGELEARLAALKGAEDCIVFGSGYLANIGIIPTLVGKQDVILADALIHNCMIAGSRLSGAAYHQFRHNDLQHLETLLQELRETHRHCLILTDGVFSMDGDLAPVPALLALAERHDAWLLTDDAHGIGVVGGGRGSSFAFGDKVEVPLQMGTLSKAVGSYGGYLCADRPVIDLMKTRAWSMVYSTGLPPGVVAASLAALDIIENEPDYCARPLANARLFCDLLGLPAPESPIVPIILGAETRALEASRKLEAEGFLVSAIRPPTVPAGTARLRLTFTACHEEADIRRLAAGVATVLEAAA
ncbi:8-amino-7-oxononanoate synthase [Parapedomonas caeni]